MENNYCNNCGKIGHLYSQCKMPITSIGVIVFRYNNNNLEYLMIRRKETLGFIDFMRGKYSIHNKEYIINMLDQMTQKEKDDLLNKDFDELWKNIWCDTKTNNQYKHEENTSKEKFCSIINGVLYNDEYFTLKDLIDESNKNIIWDEPEWGFPKGRRNTFEKDYDCAIREFCEETGYDKNKVYNIQNIMPVYEIFMGSNYKSYKHKYFIMYMNSENTLNTTNFQKTEVSKMGWFNIHDCVKLIRPYNLEKIKIIQNIHECINNSTIYNL